MARVRKRSHTESAEIAEAMDATDAVTEKSSSSDDEAGADDEEDESETISLVEGKTQKYKVALLVDFAC